MDRQLDMVVNRLPEPTWNRLNMNETKLAGVSIPTEAEYKIETAENTSVQKLGTDKEASAIRVNSTESEALWDSMETGMGKDISELGQEITPNLFIVSAGRELTRKDVTVININETGASSFANFLIHAKEGTHSHFAFVCTSKTSNKETIGTAARFSESESCSSAAETDSSGCSDTEATECVTIDSSSNATTVDGGTLTVQVKILAEENSTVHISCVQALDCNATGIFDIGGVCRDNARIELTRLELGAAKQYTGCCIALDGARSSFAADIGYKESGSQHLDMNYIARHRGRHTTSRMNITGVLRDNAFKIFRGSIDFISGCSGAKGDEQEEVLLLGDDVVNQTVPLILCAEEDVEGNHGATIGEIDEQTLFYLASRGIARGEAEQLIARARIEAVSSLLPLPELRELVSKYL